MENQAKPMTNGTKMLIGGLVVLVIILGVANWKYMKKLKEQKAADNTGMGMGSMETKTSDNAPTESTGKEVYDPTNVPK